MRALVADTEYVWEPGCVRDDDGTDRAPHPPNAIIESVAFVSLGENDDKSPLIKMGVIADGDEEARVRRFIYAWCNSEPRLVTFNGRTADMPLFLARMMRYGIVSPRFADVCNANRYKTGLHLDLYEVLGNFGAQRKGGQSDWARCIGFPGKLDVDGSKVAQILTSEGALGRAKVNAYCLQDALQAAAVLLRYCLVFGEIGMTTYDAYASELLRVAAADERTAPVVALVDRARFLLPPPVEATTGAAA